MSDIPQYRNLIGGELKPAASGAYLDSFNPATGELLGRVPASDRDDAIEAVEAAAAAFPAWSATPPALRGDLPRQGGPDLRRSTATSWPDSNRPTTAPSSA